VRCSKRKMAAEQTKSLDQLAPKKKGRSFFKRARSSDDENANYKETPHASKLRLKRFVFEEEDQERILREMFFLTKN